MDANTKHASSSVEVKLTLLDFSFVPFFIKLKEGSGNSISRYVDEQPRHPRGMSTSLITSNPKFGAAYFNNVIDSAY